MAMNLPHWLVEVVDFLGFNWPEIDEDQMRDAAKHLRDWADHTEELNRGTHQRITVDVAAVYQSQSYLTLAQAWGEGSKKHMDELVEIARGVATAIDLLADGVVAMKAKVLVQLGLASAEFIADQAASVATLGLAETALPLLYEAQNRLLNAIMQEFENEIVDYIIDHTIGPLLERLGDKLERLAFQEVTGAVLGSGPGTLKLDTDEMRRHAGMIQDDAMNHQLHGRNLVNGLGSLNYATGG
ncbi:hypothetical protein GCM10009839_23310 [Catenulispora yoronensis]|uniref:Outer membrane channel protein CpnT-like N-terminal domain-containing protein n=1 Tax=Catenulispora yoronensis TaxID=450799 RepID=A0ABP5FHH5_9ACTN